MATSHTIYKKEITDYLKERFDENASILDVGAGEGLYLEYLQPYFKNIEAIEIYKPNITRYHLKKRYKKVYNEDIRCFTYDYYDIIIFGDIIEHLEVNEAQKVLEYALDRCQEMIVAVPYLNPQGIEEGNIYEIHKQADLTDKIMRERYPYLKNVYKTSYYGYYKKEDYMENYLVKALIPINDYQGKEITPDNTYIDRAVGDEWYVSKERAEYLIRHRAVELLEIRQVEKPTKKATKKKGE